MKRLLLLLSSLVLCACSITAVFFTGAGTASGYGEARDNQGNRYKVLF